MGQHRVLGAAMLACVALLAFGPTVGRAQLIFAGSFEGGDIEAWTAAVGDRSIVYVSAITGSDSEQCGSLASAPCLTITTAIARAASWGSPKIRVANGVYFEDLSVPPGLLIQGGFSASDWNHDPQLFPSEIRGVAGSGHRATVSAIGIQDIPTAFEDFVVNAANATTNSANSYAVFVANCGSALTLNNLIINAGDGAPGADGGTGTNGTNGADGAAGRDAHEASAGYSCYAECDTGGGGVSGGAGGTNLCGHENVSGGDGGTADCPDFDETTDMCTVCASTSPLQTVTTSGADGAWLGGSGGLGGCDAMIDDACTGATTCACFLPPSTSCPQGMRGANGGAGNNGGAGADGDGGGNPLGGTADGHWRGEDGFDGSVGTPGLGGGGGGAGGGVEANIQPSCVLYGGSDFGGSGGGGGAGGCPGDGGGAGTAGGASFGLFVLFDADPNDNVPTFTNLAITRGFGGSGGDGGAGGSGGDGGRGGSGGLGGQAGSASWCAEDGGAGGNGGNGGNGGGGGGAAGGLSCGICAYGQGATDLSAWLSSTTVAGGGGGAAGSGGSPAGGDGVAGALLISNLSPQ